MFFFCGHRKWCSEKANNASSATPGTYCVMQSTRQALRALCTPGGWANDAQPPPRKTNVEYKGRTRHDC